MKDLFEKRVLLVTGKGGVGRSTASAALALAGAKLGKRVLVTEVQEPSQQSHSPVARYFGRKELPRDPEVLTEGVDGGLLVAERGTELFLGSVLRMKTIAKLAMRVPPLVRFLHATPSFHELGIFYHLLTHIRAKDRSGAPRYDIIIMDMPATGHTIALTGLPSILLGIVPSGPIAEALREGQAIMNDPARAAACVVTLPEMLPVTEALELLEGLVATHMHPGAVIANRVPQNPFSEAEERALLDYFGDEPCFGRSSFERLERTRESLSKLVAESEAPVWEWPDLALEGRDLVLALAEVALDQAKERTAGRAATGHGLD